MSQMWRLSFFFKKQFEGVLIIYQTNSYSNKFYAEGESLVSSPLVFKIFENSFPFVLHTWNITALCSTIMTSLH